MVEYLVRDAFVNIKVREFGQILFHEHNGASIWSENLS